MSHAGNKSSVILLGILAAVSLLFAGDTSNAPRISAKDLNGSMVDSKALLEKGPVIVWFWNSCCGLKKPQLRGLKEIYSAYQPLGLEILAVNEDEPKKAANAPKAIKTNGISFVVIMDGNADIYKAFHCYAVPSVYLVCRDGKIAYSKAGFISGDEKELKKKVSEHFPETRKKK
jgi:peroxiredoxin